MGTLRSKNRYISNDNYVTTEFNTKNDGLIHNYDEKVNSSIKKVKNELFYNFEISISDGGSLKIDDVLH
jgi:hypothetical protein